MLVCLWVHFGGQSVHNFKVMLKNLESFLFSGDGLIKLLEALLVKAEEVITALVQTF